MTFRRLNNTDIRFLSEQMFIVINAIARCFNFIPEDKAGYERQFTQNKARDLQAIMLLIIPFVDDKEGHMAHITSLAELTTSQKPKEDDIPFPRYNLSNFQYGRCKRVGEGIEIPLTHEMMRHNVLLLLQTIHTVGNKLMQNWVNILPDEGDRLNKRIASVTQSLMERRELTDWDPLVEEVTEPTGFSVGDIYESLSIHFYRDLKRHKWAIYDTDEDEQEYPRQYIIVLHMMINIGAALENIDWKMVLDKDQREFVDKWSSFVNAVITNAPHKGLSRENIFNIGRALVVFFDRYHRNKPDSYDPLGKEVDEEDDDEDIDDRQTSRDRIISTIKTIPADAIYEFIRSEINGLRNTYPGSHMVEFMHDGHTEPYVISIVPVTLDRIEFPIGITPKNVYNFVQSLVTRRFHDSGSQMGIKNDVFGYQWRSLSTADKATVLRRLNTPKDVAYTELIKWFNIRRYISRTYNIEGLPEDIVISGINIAIANGVINKAAQLTLRILKFQGVLSEFRPAPQLTDENVLPSDSNDRNKEQTRLRQELYLGEGFNKRWEGTFDFVSGTPLDRFNISVVNKQGKKIEGMKMDYGESINNFRWGFYYALDWLAQIGFFHRYLHCRVIYVTGSTGVGKSTQVPKLVMYAQKMIDLNNDGKTVCTIPRVDPTKGVANWVSRELSVPIYDSNYFIQYQYKDKGDSHISSRHRSRFLRFVTDGLLLAEMQNPILKVKYDDVYTAKNMYDCVIVDESHEHNANMDMILTKMKYALYYNNNLRLVIVSATMDDDEPSYRRFYRDINDNRMMPYNRSLQEHGIDRINIDRRVHISPPGMTTQYTVTETYRPDGDVVDIVMEMIAKHSGDGLVFRPGQREIIDTVSALNQVLPVDIVAIPYFTSMHPDAKKVVENISSKKDMIDTPKNMVFGVDQPEDTDKVPPGSYNRVILVATNVAEASLTIDSLRFVVDDGTQKIQQYDYRLGSASLIVVNISESSRIQRKGRVGRVADGEAVFLYKMGEMSNNRTYFNICIEDLKNTLLQVERESEEEEVLFLPEFDPNTNILAQGSLPRNLAPFLRSHYFVDGRFQSYEGQPDMYDYDNKERPIDYYQTGYSHDQINDVSGELYIVHPEEICFFRNIVGTPINSICDTVDVDESRIISPKMRSFWVDLNKMGLVDHRYALTELGVGVRELIRQSPIDDFRELFGTLYAEKFGCFTDYMKILAMMGTLRNGVQGVCGVYYVTNPRTGLPSRRIYLDKVRGLHGHPSSDIMAVLGILQKASEFSRRALESRGIVNSHDEYMRRLREYKEKYVKGIAIPSEVAELFRRMQEEEVLTSEPTVSDDEWHEAVIGNYLLIDLVHNMRLIDVDLQKWYKVNYLDGDTMTLLLENVIKMRNHMVKMEAALARQDIGDMFWFTSRLVVDRDFDEKATPIDKTLVMTYPNKIAYKLPSVPLYISVSAPAIDNVLQIAPLSKFTSIQNTLITPLPEGNVVLYLLAKPGTYTIQMIHHLRSEWVKPTTEQRREWKHMLDSDTMREATGTLVTASSRRLLDSYTQLIEKLLSE